MSTKYNIKLDRWQCFARDYLGEIRMGIRLRCVQELPNSPLYIAFRSPNPPQWWWEAAAAINDRLARLWRRDMYQRWVLAQGGWHLPPLTPH